MARFLFRETLSLLSVSAFVWMVVRVALLIGAVQ